MVHQHNTKQHPEPSLHGLRKRTISINPFHKCRLYSIAHLRSWLLCPSFSSCLYNSGSYVSRLRYWSISNQCSIYRCSLRILCCWPIFRHCYQCCLHRMPGRKISRPKQCGPSNVQLLSTRVQICGYGFQLYRMSNRHFSRFRFHTFRRMQKLSSGKVSR